MSDKPARCHFYIRERVTDDPTYRYWDYRCWCT